MNKLLITMVDGTQYEKEFAERCQSEAFLTKLEMFDGLFIDLATREETQIGKNSTSQVRINPKYIMRVEGSLH